MLSANELAEIFACVLLLLIIIPQALASLTKLLEENNISIVAQESLGEGKEEDHEAPIKILKVRPTDYKHKQKYQL